MSAAFCSGGYHGLSLSGLVAAVQVFISRQRIQSSDSNWQSNWACLFQYLWRNLAVAHSSRQRSPAAFARGPWAIPVPNGFWSVYGIGRFGAFLVELHTIYQKRTELPKLPWYYSC